MDAAEVVRRFNEWTPERPVEEAILDDRERTRKIVLDWIRDVVPLAAKMNLLPRHVDALVERLAKGGG
jgi:hypothetical protein